MEDIILDQMPSVEHRIDFAPDTKSHLLFLYRAYIRMHDIAKPNAVRMVDHGVVIPTPTID